MPTTINGTTGINTAGSWPRNKAAAGVIIPNIIPAKSPSSSVTNINIRFMYGPVTGCGRPINSTANVMEINNAKRAIYLVAGIFKTDKVEIIR